MAPDLIGRLRGQPDPDQRPAGMSEAHYALFYYRDVAREAADHIEELENGRDHRKTEEQRA